MIVVIANKYKSIIEGSKLKGLSYKCASGYYTSKQFVSNLEKLEIETLIIDITAVREVNERSTWEAFKEMIDPSKIFILLDASKQYTTPSFFATLVELGIYNFAKTPEEIINLVETPATYEEVEKYIKIAEDAALKSEMSKMQYNEYAQKQVDQQGTMQDFVHKSQEEAPPKEAPKVLKRQILTGLLLFPLLTFICTYIFYGIQLFVADNVPADSYLGEYLYSTLLETNITPLMMLGFIITYLIFMSYYVVMDTVVKRKQRTRGKFIIIPFAIFTLVIFGDYHLFGLFENVLNLNISEDGKNIYDNYTAYNAIVAGLAIATYYSKILLANSKVVKFEQDMEQKLSLVELMYIIVMFAFIAIPVLDLLASSYISNTMIRDLLHAIYDNNVLMIVLVVANILLLAKIIWDSVFYVRTEYKAEEKEEN